MSQNIKQLLKAKVCSQNPALIFLLQSMPILLFSKIKAETQRHLKTESRERQNERKREIFYLVFLKSDTFGVNDATIISLYEKKIHLYVQCPYSAKGCTVNFVWKYSHFICWATLPKHCLRLIFISLSHIKYVHFLFDICALGFLTAMDCYVSSFFLLCPCICFSQIIILNC